MSTLPHRFSEKAFRKYEPIIKQIALAFPQPVTITPSKLGLSPETVRGRLRDAITSGINNRWKSDINYGDLLHADVNGLIVSLRPDGTVIAGTKETIKEVTPLSCDSMIESNEIYIIDSPLNTDQQFMLCQLAAAKQLKNKVRLYLNEQDANSLSESFDIILEPTDKPNEYLLS